METDVLNEQPFHAFVIIAETLEKWENPNSASGKRVLMEHYQWGSELKAAGKLILAGPTDFELTSTGKVNPIGHTTGLIILNVSSREEALKWAMKDPFHLHGFRKNTVHSFKISMTGQSINEALEALKIPVG